MEGYFISFGVGNEIVIFSCSDCSEFQMITAVLAKDISVKFGSFVDYLPNPLVFPLGAKRFQVSIYSLPLGARYRAMMSLLQCLE